MRATEQYALALHNPGGIIDTNLTNVQGGEYAVLTEGSPGPGSRILLKTINDGDVELIQTAAVGVQLVKIPPGQVHVDSTGSTDLTVHVIRIPLD